MMLLNLIFIFISIDVRDSFPKEEEAKQMWLLSTAFMERNLKSVIVLLVALREESSDTEGILIYFTLFSVR